MLRRLKSRLTVATKALRPLSLYSVRSSTNSDSTDRDSVHSDPSHILSTSNDEDDIYSPVEFGAAPYEVALASRGPQTTYDAVEYCSRYDIYGEYGFDSLYEPVTYITELRVAQDEEDEVYSVPPDAVQMVGATLPRISTMPAGDPAYATYSRSSHSNRRMTIRRKDSCPSLPRKLTPTEVRSKVVEEIINTERDYVKHLEDIIEGFLKKCRLNSKLFDRESVETIFSNLESLYEFQLDFLHQLEARVSPHHMEDSQIGEVFVACRRGFEVYSEYCNNHPHAVNEMCVLQKKEQYAFFFESCRLLRNLQNIPLEGFLLLPVQKICKYPLQLSELLKYTSEDHPDRAGVEAAVEAMRLVATHINEGKRRLENIGRIGKWQEGIDGWKGPDIVETSTEMIHSSELHKISKGHSQERHFFLFDNQLIYCKKEAIGGRLSYKGRLSMDKCQIIDLPDGQETHNGLPVRHAWKMDNKTKGKDYIIFSKSPEVKSKWMDAFRREKERVAQDKASGFSVSLKMKRAAAALCSSTTAAVSAAKRRKSFNKKQVLRVTALSESVDSGIRTKIEASPARERKGKFSIFF
ncbi:Rho guanine nucleotide exchange factor 4 [Geodia barretti]|uniref:Rho guanine nucleotide exchange factor 4 n=1 Tax=Geodia barretti TaxID=519541 RepID=A0AA35WP43_GEOBA|nr:Rho guanine nucleotide exchange factor 4 [Geodia barretti]